MQTAADVRKNIMTLPCPHKKATGQYQGQFNDYEQYTLISYKFLNGEQQSEPSRKLRIYPSVKNEIKQSVMAENIPKRGAHEVTEKRGGIFNASSASEIRKANQAYRILKVARKASDDSVKEFIEKHHQDGKTGDSVIQKIQTVLFSGCIIKNIKKFFCTNDGNLKSPLTSRFIWERTHLIVS